ncbi:FAD dependent oxidoreductase [Streptomyces qinglanensis]|uniref:D-amino-acid oxidase n=1 Tax=Streptomyces qinglanensis TaxID=943816 RepID=A0A1H9W5P1_9ACTN|nr:FAD dependent oxidoreductase [Streptomyces qinglanensis]
MVRSVSRIGLGRGTSRLRSRKAGHQNCPQCPSSCIATKKRRTAGQNPDLRFTVEPPKRIEPLTYALRGPARSSRTVLIDMPTYLNYLLHRLDAAGGTVERRRLASLSDAGPATMIVNCTGLGAKDLLPDPDLRPIRGQHVVVTNPGLTEFFSEDTGLSPDLLCFSRTATPSSWAARPSTERVAYPPTTKRQPASSHAVPRSNLALPQPAFWNIGLVPGPPGPRSGWRLTSRRTALWSCTTTGTAVLA